MPVHTYTNWNSRPSDEIEQIEPFRKYFFICEGVNTETGKVQGGWKSKGTVKADNQSKEAINPSKSFEKIDRRMHSCYNNSDVFLNDFYYCSKDSNYGKGKIICGETFFVHKNGDHMSDRHFCQYCRKSGGRLF